MDHAGVAVEMFPLLGPFISDAQEKLKWGTLTVRAALYRGRVPALIYCTRPDVQQRFEKRDAAIHHVRSKWNDGNVIALLRSFLSGKPEDVFRELLPHVNTGSRQIIWLLLHLERVLYKCQRTKNLTESLHAMVALMHKLLSEFEQGKTGGEDSWEALFVLALLVRIVCREEDQLLFLLPTSVLAKCTMSYIGLWNAFGDKKMPPEKKWLQCEDVETLEDFEMRITLPETFPHVTVYYPKHARFQVYDVIMAVYDEHGTRRPVKRRPRYSRKPGIFVRGVCADSWNSSTEGK